MDAYSFADLAVKSFLFVVALFAIGFVLVMTFRILRALVRTARNLPEVSQQAARIAGAATAATGNKFKTLKDSFRAGYDGKD